MSPSAAVHAQPVRVPAPDAVLALPDVLAVPVLAVLAVWAVLGAIAGLVLASVVVSVDDLRGSCWAGTVVVGDGATGAGVT